MKLTVFCVLALAAVTTAGQLKTGPQIFTDPQASSGAPQNNDKRYITQEYTLYLTPSEIRALQKGQDSLTESDIAQTQDRRLLSEFAQSKPIEEPQEENQEQAEIAFFYNDKPVYHNPQKNVNSGNSYSEQLLEDQKLRTENAYQRNLKLIPYIASSSQKEEERNLNEQLKEQLNRISYQNRLQLKGLSSESNQNAAIERLSQNEKPRIVGIKVESEEQQKSEIEKEIENILRNNEKLRLNENANSFSQQESDYQRVPIVIQKEVSITKHLPVSVIKEVKVPVPKPVLVPVPEPYHVRVPHPYPVPVEVVKHIPVPVVRHY